MIFYPLLTSTLEAKREKINKRGSWSKIFSLTIIHQRVLQLGARKADGPKVVEHHPGGAGVDHIAQAEVGHPVQEGEDVRAGLLHGDHNDAIVLFSVVGQDRDDEVGVERVQVPGGLIQEQHHRVPENINQALLREPAMTYP